MLRTGTTLVLKSLLLIIVIPLTGDFRSIGLARQECARTGSLRSSQDKLRWDEKAAAQYLDQRAIWWTGWRVAQRDSGTFCISCHTSLPYLLARPVLHDSLREARLAPAEQKILETVRKRVALWESIAPYYDDEHAGPHKSVESRGTEVVLNALVLAVQDSRGGLLKDETRAALANMWALQLKDGANKGAWAWQNFGLRPWEADDSTYFGAAMAALAVGSAPGDYLATTGVQPHVELLRTFLRQNLAEQSLLNRAALLWASSSLSGLLRPDEQKLIIQQILSKQQTDGGWRLSSLLWTWRNPNVRALLSAWRKGDWTFQESQSDGVATGLICYALERAGVSRDNEKLVRGLCWLELNQKMPEGYWIGYSLNKSRDANSNVGQFMNDAATGFAVLALSDKK